MFFNTYFRQQLEETQRQYRLTMADYTHAVGVKQQLEIENTRLRADLDWFKLRLNAVEKERAQLIHAAIGIKIAIPEFTPTGDKTGEALQELPDLSRVGADAADEDNGRAFIPGQTENPDYSLLPGYQKTRG